MYASDDTYVWQKAQGFADAMVKSRIEPEGTAYAIYDKAERGFVIDLSKATRFPYLSSEPKYAKYFLKKTQAEAWMKSVKLDNVRYEVQAFFNEVAPVKAATEILMEAFPTLEEPMRHKISELMHRYARSVGSETLRSAARNAKVFLSDSFFVPEVDAESIRNTQIVTP